MRALLEPDAAIRNSCAHARVHRSSGNGIGPPVGNASFRYAEASVEQNVSTAARTVASMSPSESSSHEALKAQGCHETEAFASPSHNLARFHRFASMTTGGGEHDNGSTLQLVSGTVGSSVFRRNDDGAPPSIHVAALPSCALWREHVREKTGIRCVGFRNAGLCAGYALHGTHSHVRASWWGLFAWDSHIILELQGEVGGCPWLFGVRRCVSRKAHIPFDNLALWLRLHQFAPLPVSWSAKNLPTPAVVSTRTGPHKSAPSLL